MYIMQACSVIPIIPQCTVLNKFLRKSHREYITITLRSLKLKYHYLSVINFINNNKNIYSIFIKYIVLSNSEKNKHIGFHYLPSSNILFRPHCLHMRASCVRPDHITTVDLIMNLWSHTDC